MKCPNCNCELNLVLNDNKDSKELSEVEKYHLEIGEYTDRDFASCKDGVKK